MIPGVCDLSALSEDTGNYPNCLVKNKTAPPNKQKNKKKTKNIFKLFKIIQGTLRDSETLRLWQQSIHLSSSIISMSTCMHLCICGHLRLAIRDRTPHSITGNDHKAVLNKIETHTHTLSSCTSSGPFCDLSVLP